MGDKRITFYPISNRADNLIILGPLVFDKHKIFGPQVYLNLSNFNQYKRLARDYIAALYHYSSPEKIASRLSIQPYIHAIRLLLKYCDEIKLPHSIKMLDINSLFLLNFRTYIQVTRSEFKSNNRRKIFGCICRLLTVGQALGLANPQLEIPRNFQDMRDSDITQPYTAGEALDIENACRNHIQELRNRIKKGQELLAGIKNPGKLKVKRDPLTGRFIAQPNSESRWNQLDYLLWYVVNCMEGRYLKRDELLAKGHSSFNNSIMGVWNGKYRKKDVYSHLYPLTVDLIPFIILLAKLTGRNESSILNLRRDCLNEFEGRYFFTYEKARSKYALKIKFIDNEGFYSPVNLIKIVLELTEPLTRLVDPIHNDKLFIGLTTHPRELNPIKPLDPSYIKYQMNCKGGWCDLHKLMDEHGRRLQISLRRLRSYYLSQRYIQKGQLSKISRDAAHTLSQTTIGYIKNDSTKHLHEQAIENGIKSARLMVSPTVISDESLKIASQIIGGDEHLVNKVLRGEQDVFFASCKDFYNRPGGQPNLPCDKPWGCFQCSNAIFTRHVLPRVLAFKEFILQQHLELTDEDWNNKFGDVCSVIINEILPKFSTQTIAEAEQQVRNEKLYIPISLKV